MDTPQPAARLARSDRAAPHHASPASASPLRPAPLLLGLAITLALGACAPADETRQTGATGAADPIGARPAEAGPVVAPPAPPPAPPPEAPPVAADATLEQIQVTGARVQRAEAAAAERRAAPMAYRAAPPAPALAMPAPMPTSPIQAPAVDRERYAAFTDNPVRLAAEEPVSTFSIDVDTGSYANTRRILREGRLPPADAVRVEEFLNSFDYAYPAPRDRARPFSISTELAPAPWDARRMLLQVGLQGYEVPAAEVPASNLVFLIDTSGSMMDANKLPLLKRAFAMMLPRLRAQDRVSIVVYAGSAGLVLPPTPGDQHAVILSALERLQAGGGTNGGAGIELAYATARQAYVDGGVNRVLLATDGDFNLGTTSHDALEDLVERQRRGGVALSTLGVGGGNYNDHLAERLADLGNGRYAYLDTLEEAQRVLVREYASTALTIASDVKIQVEFNPALVSEYRLIGYENRALAREDFADDTKDAGEIGAGHSVTALYEVVLAGSGGERVRPLRYGQAPAPGAPDEARATAPAADELAFLALRWKQPGEDRSRLVEQPVRLGDRRAEASPRLAFAASVAAFADRLRGGGMSAGLDWDALQALAAASRGEDGDGRRGEFLKLVELARALQPAEAPLASAPGK